MQIDAELMTAERLMLSAVPGALCIAGAVYRRIPQGRYTRIDAHAAHPLAQRSDRQATRLARTFPESEFADCFARARSGTTTTEVASRILPAGANRLAHCQRGIHFGSSH